MAEEIDEKLTLFTPKWLGAVLRGERPSGETFWVGNYGTALFHQPLMALLLVLPINEAIPGILAALLALYQIALTVAVTRSRPGVPTPLGWKIAGILITLGHAALFTFLALSLFAGIT
ncbi:hypothetical protein [Shimia sagamensis]|uniref:Uncharacterized protein n=1 Tax=Shimia sagamensis TaxID=1566352 RepID=A0ABY1NWW8_9RHOB|nr:hypothetical protein [Shimia sagamensis]SMP19808.1 hypothetical protein SAMN06265373_103451 [Shimia sagamensis]